jgi:ATP-dependent RNA helicase DDX51/DBP6
MAVQTAVLPLLLPGRENYRGDVCVSAPTGSGKTLSYVLPMIESMQNRAMTRLRGLIVVPTRELVTQAREAAEMCASGTGVKIGAAVGSAALAAEQAQLVKRGQRYDPDARKALDEEADRRIMLGYDKDDDLLRDVVDLMPDHVPDYTSNVDILICTPGRLVDHIRSTPGFTIEHVEWLVIDEADRLLDSNFQDWIDIVLPALEIVAENSARAKVLATLKERIPVKRIQKVILSATMTRDLSKLASLKLNRPTLVAVVEPEKRGERDGDVKNEDGHAAILPSTLEESAVPVGDGSEKPLYLLQLLGQRLGINPQGTESLSSTVLIFCASDNNATRLARLVALLSPQLESRTAVLTKSTATSSRRKILNSFGRPGGTSVVISTDRTSRGLDVEDLSYVVNYDIPSSVTSYVHRVGRTARAGKTGEAWTLVTDTEARWFWRAIAKGNEINRARRTVDRVRLSEADELLKEAYQDALEKLGEAVRGR